MFKAEIHPELKVGKIPGIGIFRRHPSPSVAIRRLALGREGIEAPGASHPGSKEAPKFKPQRSVGSPLLAFARRCSPFWGAAKTARPLPSNRLLPPFLEGRERDGLSECRRGKKRTGQLDGRHWSRLVGISHGVRLDYWRLQRRWSASSRRRLRRDFRLANRGKKWKIGAPNQSYARPSRTRIVFVTPYCQLITYERRVPARWS
jgi:hypothetical protein